MADDGTFRREVLDRPEEEREALAEQLLVRLDPIMSALGIIFLLVVLTETLMTPSGGTATALTVLAWSITGVFVAEFLLRMAIAPSIRRFLARNWWQAVFLVLPFLRVLRLVRIFRFLRAGRILSSAIRASRTAQRRLTGRLTWLVAVTLIVILASSQLLYEFTGIEEYGTALYHAAMATIAGEPTGATGTMAAVLDVTLATYSVAVFATVAATVGAFLLERSDERQAAEDSVST